MGPGAARRRQERSRQPAPLAVRPKFRFRPKTRKGGEITHWLMLSNRAASVTALLPVTPRKRSSRIPGLPASIVYTPLPPHRAPPGNAVTAASGQSKRCLRRRPARPRPEGHALAPRRPAPPRRARACAARSPHQGAGCSTPEVHHAVRETGRIKNIAIGSLGSIADQFACLLLNKSIGN